MKKWIKIILIFVILTGVLFIINMYLKNKAINNKENKSVSSENVVLNKKNEENEIIINSNIEIDTNTINNQIEENESSIISENIAQNEAEATKNSEEKDTSYMQEDKNKDNSNKAKHNDKNDIVNSKVNDTKEEKNNTKDNQKYNAEENNQNNTNTKKTIVIDPGHQAKGDSSKEPIGPGATETKAKVTTGATGISTKQKESELVLEVALLLEKALKQQGYNVIMTRTTNNVNISNQERATIANNANADAFIRIHADSYDNSTVNRNINIMPNTK